MITPPIPITIITGFLGAGKTTLVNHIITHNRDKKIAIVVNEYGSVGIDGSLIEEQGAAETIEIIDGCICCEVRGDLITSVQKLIQAHWDLEHIIVETSGLAEPKPVADTFVLETLDNQVKLEQVICLVDALNFNDQFAQEYQTTIAQINFAHLIVVSKGETMDKEQQDALQSTIKTYNPLASVVFVSNGELDSRYIFDTADDILERVASYAAETLKHDEEEDHHEYHHEWETCDCGHNHEDTTEEEEDHHQHGHTDPSIYSFVWQTSEPLSAQRFWEFLDQLPQEVFRIKGYIFFDHRDEQFLLQKTGAKFDIILLEKPKIEETTLVFIGKNMEEDTLVDQLEEICKQAD